MSTYIARINGAKKGIVISAICHVNCLPSLIGMPSSGFISVMPLHKVAVTWFKVVIYICCLQLAGRMRWVRRG